MKVLLVASSSGGHIYPALKLGTYLKKMDVQIKYLGIENEIEENIYPVEERYLIKLPKSFKKSLNKPFLLWKIYKELNEYILDFDVIIGFGGFITYFVSTLSNIKQKLFYIHEANVVFGDSNKLSLSRVKKAFTSFKVLDDKKYHNKIVFTGNPTTENLKITKTSKNYISFVFGSLGSKTVLNKVISYLKYQNRDETFLLVTSKKLYESTKKVLEDKKNVIVKDVINQNDLYRNSRLIFVRGGASTLSEVIYSLTNCVCIPSPYVKHHHQELNAEYLLSMHALTILNEEDISNREIDKYIDLYSNNVYSKLEIENQKRLKVDNPCLNIYLEIINDYKEKL